MIEYKFCKNFRINNIINYLEKLCSEIKGFQFAILYGSSVCSQKESDIDVKIFVSSPIEIDDLNYIVNAIKDLSNKFGSGPGQTSKDVPYEIKTVIPLCILEKAISLQGFKRDQKKMTIPKIQFNKKFLSSETCQLRTILSALTTPNIMIGNNKELYINYVNRAFNSIKSLICNVYELDPTTSKDYIIKLLICSPDGRKYKEYLGYNDTTIIKDHLFNNLH
jgi:hypothetical protein